SPELVQRPGLDDYAAAHDRDAVGDQLGFAERVRRDDESGASRTLLREVVAHVRRGDGIQTRGGLVAEDPVWIVERGADQRAFLRHAARIRRERSVSAVGELKTLQQTLDSHAALGLRHAV